MIGGAHLACFLSPFIHGGREAICRSDQPQRVIWGQSAIRDKTVLCKGKTPYTHEGLLPQIRLTSTLRVPCRSESGIWPAQKKDFSKINQCVLFPPVMATITAADCTPNFPPPVIRQGCLRRSSQVLRTYYKPSLEYGHLAWWSHSIL